ncbi:hypothetical protein pb186bvf_001968 [Paramecium bursaria]
MSREPYNRHQIFFDGSQRPSIKVFGNNQKNSHNFDIGWSNYGYNDRVAQKVGTETNSYVPAYTVQSYRKNSFAGVAQRSILDSKKQESLEQINLYNKMMNEKMNKYIQECQEQKEKKNFYKK